MLKGSVNTCSFDEKHPSVCVCVFVVEDRVYAQIIIMCLFMHLIMHSCVVNTLFFKV